MDKTTSPFLETKDAEPTPFAIWWEGDVPVAFDKMFHAVATPMDWANLGWNAAMKRMMPGEHGEEPQNEAERRLVSDLLTALCDDDPRNRERLLLAAVKRANYVPKEGHLSRDEIASVRVPLRATEGQPGWSEERVHTWNKAIDAVLGRLETHERCQRLTNAENMTKDGSAHVHPRRFTKD